MAGDSATSVRLPALLLLLLTILNSSCFVVSGEFPSLMVAEYASLQISPKLAVEKSPGSRPGSQVVCERVEINGLSRFRNLTSFFSSVKVKATIVNSNGRPPNITFCFHRNASLALGMCHESQWEKLTKGSWARSMSPFDHKLLDIRIVGSSEETIEIILNKEFYSYRIIFLVLGITLMTFASSLSNSLIVYYGGAMTLGVLLVILVILFQGMRILPSGRKSSLGLVLYGSIVGIGSFLFSYIPTLLHSLLMEMGISEDVYSPVAVFLLAFIVLLGAWLGFWAVRKLVLTEDGSIDTGVAHFVSWSFRIIASSMILQSSVDPLLAVAALVCGILIPSAFKWFFKMLLKTNKGKRRESYKKVFEDSNEEEHGVIRKLEEKNTFYSSFHDTRERRQYSKEEWGEFTKMSTKKALESLVCSPDFNRWAVAHADRITLRPKPSFTPTDPIPVTTIVSSATILVDTKLWVAPLSIKTTTSRSPIFPQTFIVRGGVSPLTEFSDTSAMSQCTLPSPSSSLSCSSTIKTCNVLLGHLCPGANFPSHRKHNPLARFSANSVAVSLLNPPGELSSFLTVTVATAVLGFG